MKKLNELFSVSLDTKVYGVVDDSRLVKEGYIFVATKGFHVDHYDFILDAINRGCCFVACDREIKIDFPHIIVENINDTYKELCRKYYEISLLDFSFIGITGAAGGRDSSKRPIIGKMVMDLSDIAIFTMDDPRYEDVNTIIDEMVGDRRDYYRFIDRKEAIWYALSIAQKNSVVLILGKGRDNYMAVEDKKLLYSDYDVIYDFFHK